MSPVGRFASALREMRWAQVVVELALLIAGILVALAVDGWIEDRRDVRTERAYLERLQRDLDRDLDILAEFIEFERRQVDNSVRAYRALRAGVPPQEREAVATALSQLTSRRTLRLVRATYSDLVATGNLGLIRDAGLRDEIINLYEANERALLIRDRNNQVFVDQMYMLYLMDSGLVAPRPTRNLPSLERASQSFGAAVDLPVDASSDRLWQLPAGSPEWGILANKVWYRGLVSSLAVEQSQQTAAAIRAVRDSIEAELAGRSTL